MFISFEGGEGSGKSTQIRRLADWLAGLGHEALVTREPGGEPVAEAIRGVLLQTESPVEPLSELLLFIAARSQITERVIRPALQMGQIVLCDRFIDSTVVYQGHARKANLELIRELNLMATGGLIPDLTLLLDVDPEVGLTRQPEHNRMESLGLDFHRAVRAGYLAEADLNPNRIVVVNADDPLDEVASAIRREVSKLLDARSRSMVS